MAAFSGAWIALNAGLYLVQGWDPYPFVFLNLVYSIMSAATMPVLLISQNRQAQIDRLHARANHRITLRTQRQLDLITARLGETPRSEDIPQ